MIDQSDLFPETKADLLRWLYAKADELAPAGRDAFPAICGTVSTNGGPSEPAGLYSDESTMKCVASVFRRMLNAVDGVELYQPSNGDEGDRFTERWCYRCAKDNLDPNTFEGGCSIIAYTMALNIDDADYPRAWRLDAKGNPCCTEFEERKP